ncbi:TetR/AcrR family transcriptional regulator [Kribbella lupini]|uniref:TetR/AcrR family transcriptional regulator n=1 Tax=Kribbella lupini TaxID=291602 RepID=A0ABN2BVG2_9ACTN
MPKVTVEHRLARRAQIVAAARHCVIEQGFHKTTMADVIRESGLSAGAVYGYFRSKDEIVEAIADDALSAVGELFEDILAMPDPLPLGQAMRKVLDHVVDIAERPGGDVTRVALQAWAEAVHNPAIAAIAAAKWTPLRSHFAAIVRRAQAGGSLPPDADPDHVAQALFGLLPGFLMQRLLLGDVTPESYADGIDALLGSHPQR